MSGRALEKAPKSYASERRLAFGGNEDLESLLKRLHRDWERRRKQDPKYNPEGYVAVNEAGKPYQPDVLCQRIAQFIAVQGLPPISLHGLRHSFASVANSQNVPMFSISKALGHSSTSVTSAVYMHLFDDAVGDGRLAGGERHHGKRAVSVRETEPAAQVGRAAATAALAAPFP